MKKFLTIALLVSCVAILFKDSTAGDRKILQERFTSSTCGPCASNNPTLDAFINAQDPDKFVSISYHMNWPSPGNDPMYLANVADNSTRRSNYNVNAIPDWFFDGVTSMFGGSYGQLQAAYDSRTNILSPVSMILTETRNGNTVNATVVIYCESLVSNPTATLHFVIVEDPVQYSFPPGTNGESHFGGVMRKMLPSGLGTAITLLPGSKITVNYTYNIDQSWIASNVRSVAFIQGAPLEIQNAATLTNNFNLYSLPAYRTAYQGQAQNANYKLYIPSVADGYNSAVSFGYEVSPATPGISVSFANGNTISSFPDSLGFTVSSAANVPAGEYKVIMTGTSASGKVHKTVVNYLVGKNYIVTGTNRKNLNYKIDGSQYNTSRVFTWDLGSQHSLEAVTPQTVGNNRYVFTDWSNGGANPQTVTIGIQDNSYTADYKVQFRMIGQVDPAGLPVTINGAGNYFDSASAQQITLSATQVQFNGHTYYFNRWEGNGTGSYSGTSPNANITMGSVIIQKAVFDTVNVGISNYSSTIPNKFELYQNYPNPFNPTTTIKFDIAKSSFTSIVVYDMLGKEVANLISQQLNPGSYQYTLNASNFPSGIYYYKIKTDSYTEIKKMILLK